MMIINKSIHFLVINWYKKKKLDYFQRIDPTSDFNNLLVIKFWTRSLDQMIPFKKGQDNILNSSFNLTFQIKGKKRWKK